MIISQEKSTLTSPPKKTKKSSKQKITPEVIEPKNQKGEKSEIIAGNSTAATITKGGSKRPDVQQLTGSEVEQKNENISDGPIVHEKKEENVIIEEKKSPKKVPSTESTNKKLKLRRQKTEVVGPSPKKSADAEVDKPVPKPRGPSKVVSKPREESIGTDNEITKAKSDWDSEDDTKEPLDHDEKTDSMQQPTTGSKRPDVHQLTGSEDEESESVDEDETDDEVEDEEEESGKCAQSTIKNWPKFEKNVFSTMM